MRETDMDTVLLFGGRSFLGGHICRALVKRGYRVLLHSTSSGNFRNLSDVIPDVAIEAAFCGFGEHEELRRLMGRCHFAIYAAVPYSRQSIGQSSRVRRDLIEFEATLNFLAISNIDKTVFVSVSGTIGRVEGGVANESCIMGPGRPKSWGHLTQKTASEEMILRFVRNGLKAVIVNPSMCVGEHDTRPSTGEFFIFISWLPFALMPNASLNIVDVEDVAIGTILALEKGAVGERYILCGINTNMGALIQRIKKLRGKPMPRVAIPRSIAIPAAYFFELINVVARRDKPLVPLLGIELIEQGSQHLTSAKAIDKLGFAAGNAWPAVDRAFHWYVKHGIL
jgi:dihydroflavonol-4-reductase